MHRKTEERGVRRWLWWWGVVVLVAVACSGVVAAGAWASLPDGRAYELVSPVEKGGAGVVSDSQRTRAAADGSALGFVSLGAFGDAVGTGVATEYVSVRTGAGWATHAVMPLQSSTTFDGLSGGLEPLYVGEFSPDLTTGVFFAQSPLTVDPGTANVTNLYLRSDLRTPGTGTYTLLTACPLCDANQTPLAAPTSPNDASGLRPWLAWTSPDGGRVAFESPQRLTADTPSPVTIQHFELFVWDHGTVMLAGRVPRVGMTSCDDVNGPACVGSSYSIAGQGASNLTRTPDVLSDGTDGHWRVFFTHPTRPDGITIDPASSAGQLYVRVDGSATVQLNASERGTADAFAPATFLDASADGERAFFMTTQALTDDAPVNGDVKIYMYDTTALAGHHLTLINADHEPGDGPLTNGRGIVGVGGDGHYVYFITVGQIVAGQPLLGPKSGLFLWHDGVVRYIATLNGGDVGSLISSGPQFAFGIQQARTTPDGHHLLYQAVDSNNLLQLYLYDADTNAAPACVSCDPTGAPSTHNATLNVRTNNGATSATWHENTALSDDGSRVFFSTAQPLTPDAVNNKVNVYEYDVTSRSVRLISTGTSTDDSWFMDASSSGGDVFFTTRQQLVASDIDSEYDVYDARIGTGIPQPPPPPVPCEGQACQGALTAPPAIRPITSDQYAGVGDASGRLGSRTPSCRHGFVHKRVRGKVRCVKRSRRAKARRAARAGAHVRNGR